MWQTNADFISTEIILIKLKLLTYFKNLLKSQICVVY